MSDVTVGESYLSEFLPEVREFIRDTKPRTNTTRGGRRVLPSSLVWEATFDGGQRGRCFVIPCREPRSLTPSRRHGPMGP